MKEIFLITFYDGDYEGCAEPIGYALSEDTAQNEVEYRNGIHQEVYDYRDAVHERRQKVRSENPDTHNYTRPLERPKWPSGLGKDQITDKMKAERTKVDLKNKRIREENSLKESEYNKKIYQIVSVFEKEQFDKMSSDAQILHKESKGDWSMKINPGGFAYIKITQIV